MQIKVSLFVFPARCGLPKEEGSCGNYSIKWYYDVAYGDCSRFWYGGCDGNENRFDSREECQGECIEPEDEIGEANSPAFRTVTILHCMVCVQL